MYELINSPVRPSLEDIRPLALARGISDVGRFWDFFDEIQRLWVEQRELD